MAGHSRPKDGVLSHAYVPAIHVFACRSYEDVATSAGMTKRQLFGHDVEN